MRVRNSKGRYVSDRSLVDRVDELKRAGFTVSYAWRDDAARFGYLNSSSLSGDYCGGYRVRTVTGLASEVDGEPYVSFDGVATTECAYGQADTVRRSNYTAIRRDYPNFPFVDTSYLNTNSLGCFVSDLDDDMTGLFIGLVENYPVYDESAMSDLKYEEIHESWAGFMRGEVWSELPEVTRTIMWDSLGEDAVTDLWWECVSNDVFGNYPEHHGTEVVWGDVSERAADFRPFLVSAYWAKRTGGTLADGWVLDRMRRVWDQREVDRIYAAWMADTSILHTINSWETYLSARGWRMTSNGPRRVRDLGKEGTS